MCIRDRSRGENYKNIIKNSDDEVLVEVGCNTGMLVCVDGLKRVCKESIEVEGLQRVGFPKVYCEPRCLQMLLLKGKSPLLMEDMRSLSCSLKFDELVPSVWDGRESVIWCYGERYLERELCVDREIKLFKVNRNYEEFVERLDVERVGNYIEHLPCSETEVVAEVDDKVDELLTYLTLTENTKGEITLPDVDRNFEIMVCNNICIINSIDIMEQSNNDDYYNYNSHMYSIVNEWCSHKIRLLYDDGG